MERISAPMPAKSVASICLSTLLWVLTAATPLAAQELPPEIVLTTEKVKLPARCEQAALTDDGRQLLVVLDGGKTLLVLDMVTMRQEKEVTFADAMRIGLCRNDLVLLLAQKKGELSVLSRKEGWKVTASLTTDDGLLTKLLAPRGAFFKGKFLALSVPFDPAATRADHVMAVDLEAKTLELIRVGGFPQGMSYDGRYVINDVGFIDYDYFVRCLPMSNVLRDRLSRTVVEERTPSAAWHYSGLPAAKRPLVPGLVLDPSDPVEYWDDFDHHELVVRRLDERRTVLARVRYKGMLPHGMTPVRLGDAVYFHSWNEGELQRCVVPMAKINKGATSAARSTSQATSGPTSSPDQLPTHVAVGQTLSLTLPGTQAGATFTVVKAPESLALKQDGSVTWTPASADLGAQEMKFKRTKGEDVSFVRWSVMVLKDATEGATLPEDGVVIVERRHRVLSSLDGQNVLLLQDNRLTILDADGREVLRQADLPDLYQHLAERPDYYIAVNHWRMDLLDKKTLAVIRRISLPTEAVADVSIQPQEAVTYLVGMFPYQEIGRVLRINETTGSITVIPTLYGHRVLALDDPKRLILAMETHNGRDHITDALLRASRGIADVDISGPMPKLLHFRETTESAWMPLTPLPGGGLMTQTPARRIDWKMGKYLEPELPTGVIWSLRLSDVTKNHILFEYPKVVEPLPQGAAPGTLLPHPVLDLAALPYGNRVYFYQTSTGRPVDGEVDVEGTPLSSIVQAWWTPGGRYLLLECPFDQQTTRLRAVPMKLTKAQQEELARRQVKARSVKAPVDKKSLPPVQIAALESLALKKPLSPGIDAIGIYGTFGTTCMVVGKTGYVVVADDGRQTSDVWALSAPAARNAKVKEPVKLQATVVRRDVSLHLALLKVEKLPPGLSPVCLAEKLPAAGDSVKWANLPADSTQRQLATVKGTLEQLPQPTGPSPQLVARPSGAEASTYFVLDPEGRISYFRCGDFWVSALTIRAFLAACTDQR